MNSRETKAYLNVFRGDISTNALSNESVTKLVEINPNGRANVEITVPISFASKEFYKTNKYYRASVTVDGIFALSEGFEIKLPKSSSNKTCFCNRDLTSEELKNIIIQLRKQEVYIENGRLIRDSKGSPILKNGKKQFTDITMYDELHEDLFNLDYPEKLNSSEANYSKFTEALNKAFKDYDINTCIRKIHFLAQCYHETQRFTITYEKNPNSNVSGGPFYRGRGLIQLA